MPVDLMCDFHSIVVRRDGAKAHVAENSHSAAVEAAKWRENQPNRDVFFVECEWGGDGKYPGAERISRGEISEKQRKIIDSHYEALAKLLENPKEHGERMCFDGGIFSDDEYADIRWKVMVHHDCPKRLIERLALTSLYGDGSAIRSLHPAITKIGGSFKVEAGYSITAPALAEVKGDVYVDQGATLTAPALAEVKGYVRVDQGATLTAPLYKGKIYRS